MGAARGVPRRVALAHYNARMNTRQTVTLEQYYILSSGASLTYTPRRRVASDSLSLPYQRKKEHSTAYSNSPKFTLLTYTRGT